MYGINVQVQCTCLTKVGTGFGDMDLPRIVVQFTAVIIITHIGRQAVLHTVLGTGISDLGLDRTDHCPMKLAQPETKDNI